MNSTSALLNKADIAIESAAEKLTTLLRSDLQANGWTLEELLSVSVIFDGDRFNYSFSGEYASAAENKEFGTETTRPNGAVRKFFNRSEVLDNVFLKSLEAQLGKLL